uniref:Uncharacterized protein n=1 Tax=Leersia perrieri TaxID=77586 RepID=A0A0D9W2I8_9ORYZ
MKASTVAVLVMIAMLMMSVTVYSDHARSHGVMNKQITAVASSHGSSGGSVFKVGIVPGRKLISEAANTDTSVGVSGAGTTSTTTTTIDSNRYMTAKWYGQYMNQFGGRQP